MVDGLPKEKIVAVDLDGTYIRGNTLHIYILAGLKNAGFLNRIRISSWLILRKLHIVSHPRMKFAILKLIEPTEKLLREFKETVDGCINERVVALLDDYRRLGCRIVLVTAAADVYVPHIWDGEFIATSTYGNPAREECRGQRKVERLSEKFGGADVLEAVLTDHYDDLPLLRFNRGRNYLVNPSPRTIERLDKEGINYEIIK